MITSFIEHYTSFLSDFLKRNYVDYFPITGIPCDFYIESIFFSSPLGYFLIKEDKTGLRKIVFGTRRFSYLYRYKNDLLRIESTYSEINGKLFSEIPIYLRNRYDDTIVHYDIIPPNISSSEVDRIISYYRKLNHL